MNFDKTPKYTITITDDEGKEFTCRLRKIDRVTFELALKHYRKDEEIRAGEIILNTCWIDGDEEIKTNDELLIAAALQVKEMIIIFETSIKKN